MERPEILVGKTYKIRPSSMNAALYITINDQTLEDGRLRPFELFLNTKDVSTIEWMTAFSRLTSAIMRVAPSIDFLIEELKQVHDPRGGYFADRKLMPGVVAHIAEVLEKHVSGS